MAAGESPDLIRKDVERTRDELGATAEALATRRTPRPDEGSRERRQGSDHRQRQRAHARRRDIRRSGGRVRHTAEHTRSAWCSDPLRSASWPDADPATDAERAGRRPGGTGAAGRGLGCRIGDPGRRSAHGVAGA